MAFPDRGSITSGSTPISGGGANRVLFEDATGTFVSTSAGFTYTLGTLTLSIGATGNLVAGTMGTATAANFSLVYNTSAVITASGTGATGLRFNGYGAGAITADASGNLTAVSDERVKTDIRPFERGLEAVLQLAPISYAYTIESGLDQTKRDYSGFSANQVESIIPEAVSRSPATDEFPDGLRSFDDRPIVAALVNAVKELSVRVERLEELLAV